MKNNWWNHRVFYEIYMPSFKDSNKDGIGDFKGITSKLDHLKFMGVKGIWLTPFYPSPRNDNGYDIKDYYNIDPLYGDMDDFKNFIEEAHERDIKVIVDLVLNHTSSEHQWFLESKKSKTNPKRDFYIWKTKDEINNWESFFGKSAWEYDEATDEYYYHAFAKEQVDLNWMNQEVRNEMYKIIEFWASKGIDGFRLDVINFLKVNNSFENNPKNEKGDQEHLYDKDQPGVLEVISEIVREIKSHGDLFVVGEVGSDDLEVLKNYVGHELLDVVFNFNLGSMESFNINKIYENIKNMNEIYGEEKLETIFFNSHDMPRMVSRFENSNIEKNKLSKLMATLICTAKGVPFIYYGEEIGLENYKAESFEDINDIQGRTAYDIAIEKGYKEEKALEDGNEKSRDKSRAPMQWDNSKNYGFTEDIPWLKFPKSSEGISVENQKNIEDSILNYYKKVIEVRNNCEALKLGKYNEISLLEEMIYFERTFNEEVISVYLNFGDKEQNINHEENFKVICSSLENNKNNLIKPYEAKILKKES
ncbi:alpha-glucosidase [Clostridium sp.]|uniref:alpha-glucosidase n=1 Tax=Clostridium sp. TaxID=1506 RepID=UPI00346397C9